MLAAHPYEEPAYDVSELADAGLATTGTGRIGTLPQVTLAEFAEHVAAVLPTTAHGVRVAGDADRPVRRVAVCGGAGDFLLDRVAGLGVDAYVTSDLRHHPAAEFVEKGGPALVDRRPLGGRVDLAPGARGAAARRARRRTRDPGERHRHRSLDNAPVNADPAAQLRLLDLQALDSQVDKLRHQRANPPQAAEIKDLLGRRADVDGRLRDQRIVVDDLALAQAKADADVEQVKARRTRDRERMDSAPSPTRRRWSGCSTSWSRWSAGSRRSRTRSSRSWSSSRRPSPLSAS